MIHVCFNLQVDCTANTNTCNKYGVSGYPTLKIFRDGEEAGAYDGPRTAGKNLGLHSGNRISVPCFLQWEHDFFLYNIITVFKIPHQRGQFGGQQKTSLSEQVI